MKEALKAICEVISTSNRNSYDLWKVLTALRGPDDDDEVVKMATTGVIRHKLFAHFLYGSELTAESTSFNGFLLGIDTPEKLEVRKAGFNDDSHFWLHAKDAFVALGLKWDKVNT